MSVLTPARTSGRTANAQENFSAWANRHRKWLFAAPAMIFVGVLIIFPLAWTLYEPFFVPGSMRMRNSE